jgi:hypothetical protein
VSTEVLKINFGLEMFPGDEFNNNTNEAERYRRQQILRLGLILCLVLLLMDGGGTNNKQNQSKNNDNIRFPLEEITLPNFLTKELMKTEESTLLKEISSKQSSLNATGLYGGFWRNLDNKSIE